eukprot:283083-Chlamydomonas_euryale.AAC.1
MPATSHPYLNPFPHFGMLATSLLTFPIRPHFKEPSAACPLPISHTPWARPHLEPRMHLGVFRAAAPQPRYSLQFQQPLTSQRAPHLSARPVSLFLPHAPSPLFPPLFPPTSILSPFPPGHAHT